MAKTVTEKQSADYTGGKVFQPEASSIKSIILMPGTKMQKFYTISSSVESDKSTIYCAIEVEDN